MIRDRMPRDEESSPKDRHLKMKAQTLKTMDIITAKAQKKVKKAMSTTGSFNMFASTAEIEIAEQIRGIMQK